MFDYGSLFVFQFCEADPVLLLLSGSGDQLCGPLPALLWGVAYYLPSLSAFIAFPVFI
jgi:hypothetical protein